MSGGGGSGSSMYSGDASAPIAAGSESVLGSGGPDACAALSFVARLRGVNRDEADEVEIGDVLAVELWTTPRPAIVVLRAFTDETLSPTPLGTLLSRLGELLPCLQRGPFTATIVAINGGDIRVRVEPGTVF